MKSRNKYYGLDEIGFIGTQGNKTANQIRKDIQMTVRLIKNKQPNKVAIQKSDKLLAISGLNPAKTMKAGYNVALTQ